MAKELHTLSNRELIEYLDQKAGPPSPEEREELARRGIVYDWHDANSPSYYAEERPSAT